MDSPAGKQPPEGSRQQLVHDNGTGPLQSPLTRGQPHTAPVSGPLDGTHPSAPSREAKVPGLCLAHRLWRARRLHPRAGDPAPPPCSSLHRPEEGSQLPGAPCRSRALSRPSVCRSAHKLLHTLWASQTGSYVSGRRWTR